MQLGVGDPMEIYFCDLCNESVPEADLRQGRAVRRSERVICASCEAAMSAQVARGGVSAGLAGAGGAGVAGGSDPSGAARPAHGAPGHSAQPARRGGGLGVALVALIFGVGASAYLLTEIEEQRLSTTISIADIQGDLARLRGDFSRIVATLDRETGELDRRTRQEVDDARRELGIQVADLRRELTDLAARSGASDAQLAELRSSIDEVEASGGRRLDELNAQLARGRQDVTFFGERLAALEQVVQGGGGARPAGRQEVGEEKPLPPWHGAVADLQSENPGTRWNAVQTLGESADPAVVPHLVPSLGDADVFVRMAVARVLGDLAAPEGIEPLIDALEDEDAAVREMAMVSLRSITGRNFKFDAVASPADRAKKVKAWRQWWSKAKEEYFPPQ